MCKMSQSHLNINVCQNIIGNVNKRQEPLFLDLYFQYYTVMPQSFLFIYTCIFWPLILLTTLRW